MLSTGGSASTTDISLGAIRAAERWLVEHQEANGSFGRIEPWLKRTEGLCLFAGCRSLTRTALQRNWRISNSVS